MPRAPHLTVSWADAETEARGHVVIDTRIRGVAGGGLRMRPGLTLEEVGDLARAMTRKEALAFRPAAHYVPLGGAKGGIDFDPYDPRALDVLRRFLEAMSPLLRDRWAYGEDMGVRQDDLDGIAAQLGFRSTVDCVLGLVEDGPDAGMARLDAAFAARDRGIGLGELIGGYGVARAALVALDELGVPRAGARAVTNSAGAQVDALAGDRDEAQTFVQLDRAVDEPNSLAHGIRRCAAAQCTQSCGELLVGEGLHEVVVGARVQSVDAIVDSVPGGQHEDADTGAAGAQRSSDLQPRDVGQADVQDDGINSGRVASRSRPVVPSAASSTTCRSSWSSRVSNRPELWIVFDNKNVHMACGARCRGRSGRPLHSETTRSPYGVTMVTSVAGPSVPPRPNPRWPPPAPDPPVVPLGAPLAAGAGVEPTAGGGVALPVPPAAPLPPLPRPKPPASAPPWTWTWTCVPLVTWPALAAVWP